MSYLLSVLADKPLGLWMMDDSAPFQDYSGYNAVSVVSAGAMSSLVDTFAAALDTSLWPGTYGSVANTGGQSVIQTRSGYSGLASAQAYDFTNSAIYISVVPTTQPGNGTREFFFEVIKDSNNKISFFQSGSSTLNMRQTIDGVVTTTNVAYNGTSMLFLRLKGNATHFIWDTSPDGSTWTNQRTTTVVNNWTSVYTNISSGYYGSETSPPATVINSVNTTATSGAPSGLLAPANAAALVASAKFSQVVSDTTDIYFDSAVYKQGYENIPFTLEVSLRVINETSGGEQKVLSSASNYDGITVNGTIIKFSTKYLTEAPCEAIYDIQTKRNVHVVGVHTRDKNQLFVDGELVSETTITDAQRADSFVAGDGRLWMGASASTQKIAVNGVAIYATGLSDSIIKAHFNAARRTTLVETVAPTFSGVRFPMSLNLADTFVRMLWQEDEDWKIGTLNDVTLVNTQIVPQLAAGVSVPGDWQVALPLDQSGLTDVYGLSMQWDGAGVVISASLDGSTWETAVRGKKLALIPDGFDPTDKDLFIKASFVGGITDDPSYLDNLFIVGFVTGAMPNIGGRDTTFTDPASPMTDSQPIEQRDDWGVLLNGGSVVISADGSPSPQAMFSMNVWLKKLTATDPTFSISGTTNYKNGIAAGTMNQGEWVMWTMTKATELTGAITISGNVRIGHIELFDHQLTAQEVADLYSAETGVNVAKISDTDAITVTNPNPSTRIYDYTWAITGAG